MRKKTADDFVKQSNVAHNNKYDYSKVEYTNNKTKVCIVCPKHGEFWQTPQDHIKGRGCPKCNGGILYSNDEWLSKFIKAHENLYDYSLIDKSLKLSSNMKVPICCNKHGIFYQACINHSLGQGCPKCANEKNAFNKAYSKEIFKKKSNSIYNGFYDYSKVKYINNHTEVCIICPKHGEFYQKPNVHLLGHGCPKCSTSMLEKEIINLFDTNRIEYIHRARKTKVKWIERLELDFYLPQYNVAIECQGLEHFKPIDFFGGEKSYKEIIERDKLKRKLCDENGVKLLYYSNLGIKYPYEVYENKEKLLTEITNDKKQ